MVDLILKIAYVSCVIGFIIGFVTHHNFAIGERVFLSCKFGLKFMIIPMVVTLLIIWPVYEWGWL